jgi:hypothetical protein
MMIRDCASLQLGTVTVIPALPHSLLGCGYEVVQGTEERKLEQPHSGAYRTDTVLT